MYVDWEVQVLLQTHTFLYSDMMIIKLTSTVSYVGTRVHDCTRLHMYARGWYTLHHVYYW